jgi:hypothetical protein
VSSHDVDPKEDLLGPQSVDEVAEVKRADIGSVLRIQVFVPEPCPRKIFYVDEKLWIYFFFDRDGKLIRYWVRIDDGTM